MITESERNALWKLFDAASDIPNASLSMWTKHVPGALEVFRDWAHDRDLVVRTRHVNATEDTPAIDSYYVDFMPRAIGEITVYL